MNAESDNALNESIPRDSPKSAGTQFTNTVPVPTAYEDRAVAFLDILGWRDLIDRSMGDTGVLSGMGSALTYLKLISELPRPVEDWLRSKSEAAGQPFDPADGRLQFAQFSDSIIISGTASMFLPLIFQVWGINRTLFFHNGLLLRGAITTGLMYHKGSVAFGPALTAAYDLEHKSATYPRVILDPKLTSPTTTSVTQQTVAPPFSTWFRQSSDGLWFFDYLNPLLFIPPNFNEEPIHSQMLKEQVVPGLNHARRLICDALVKYSECTKIWEKYRWMADYFNMVNSEYATAEVDPITASYFAVPAFPR
jgi:hypothetical protein